MKPTEIHAKFYTKRVAGKPIPPKNQATKGRISVTRLNGINPQRTPAKMYTKKIPK